MLRVALLFLAFTAGAWAQCGLLVPNPTTGRLDCAGGAALVSGASLPATCSVGQVFFLTVGSVGGYQCVASNTWSAFTAGPSTIQYGAVYQAYSAGATTVTITHNFGQIQHAESNCVDTTTGFYLGGASSVAPGANADIIVFSVAAPHDGYCVINDPRFAAGSSYWSRSAGVLSPTTTTDSVKIGTTLPNLITLDPAVGLSSGLGFDMVTDCLKEDWTASGAITAHTLVGRSGNTVTTAGTGGGPVYGVAYNSAIDGATVKVCANAGRVQIVMDGTATSGHIITPSTGTGGQGADSGQTSKLNVANTSGIAGRVVTGCTGAGCTATISLAPSNDVGAASAGGGTVTSVGAVGTAGQITVTGASPITGSGSWTLSLPANLSSVTGFTPGGNFTLTQNSVASLTSVESGAVVNTLYLSAGKVGIGNASPNTALNISGGTPTTAAGGLQFGTDASANLYRRAAGILRVDGSLETAGLMGPGSASKAAFYLTSADQYGKIQNDASNVWSLAYSSSATNSLGTPVLAWNAAGSVGIGPLNTSPTGTMSCKDGTPTTGHTNCHVDLGAADSASTVVFTVAGAATFAGNISSSNDFNSGGTATSFRAGTTGEFYWNGKSVLASPTDGVIKIANNAETDFSRLQFGGTTSSFPALKRSTTKLLVRLADDSADAEIDASTAVFSGASITVGGHVCTAATGTFSCT